MNKKFHLLAADIGATNSRFAVFEVQLASDNKLENNYFPHLYLRKEHWLETKNYNTFASLLKALRNFSQQNNFLPPNLACACIAAPGPVEGRFCYPPNINWTIDALEVNQILGLGHIFLVNDFVAQGYACMLARSPQGRNRFELETIWQPEAKPENKPHTTRTPSNPIAHNASSHLANNLGNNLNLWANEISPKPPVAVVGAGSGLGKAIVLEDLQIVLPSEGGHANFAFIGCEEFAYAKFLEHTYGMAPLENVEKAEEVENDQIINGPGLAKLYAYHSKQLNLAQAQQHGQRHNHSKQFASAPNGIPNCIPSSVDCALEAECNCKAVGKNVCKLERKAHEITSILQGDISQNPAAQLTLKWYARFYGRICKNFVLDSMALGGLYITGGMACRVPVLQHPAFLQSFQQSKTQSSLLKKVPVFHIQSQQAGLRGAALLGALQYFKSLKT